MADITYTIILQDAGIKAFTMPNGFWPDVEIHCWGAGGGTGRGGAKGGGGGYAKTTANVVEGDEVSLQIGQPGGNANGMTGGSGGLDTSYRLFHGGTAGSAWDEDNDSGAGGGGGGASWVAVNDAYVCVAAGGGGASGYGEDGGGAPGNPGLPGGTYTTLNSNTIGANSDYAGSPSGGAGAGLGLQRRRPCGQGRSSWRRGCLFRPWSILEGSPFMRGFAWTRPTVKPTSSAWRPFMRFPCWLAWTRRIRTPPD